MEVKERIIEQAVEMYFHSGIKAVTMNDISRNAGISKRTIYEVFHDKDDLLRHCLRFIDDSYDKQCDQLVRDSDNTIQIVFGLMKIGANAIRQINPLFLDDLKRFHNKVWKDVYKINTEKQKTQIMTILKKGINQGFFRKEIDIEILTLALMQQLNMISDKRVFPEHIFSPVDVFENVVIVFFRGISTAKGIEVIDKMLGNRNELFGQMQ